VVIVSGCLPDSNPDAGQIFLKYISLKIPFDMGTVKWQKSTRGLYMIDRAQKEFNKALGLEKEFYFREAKEIDVHVAVLIFYF